MATDALSAPRPTRWRQAADDFARTSVVFVTVVWLARAYELLLLRGTPAFPSGSVKAWMRVLVGDAAFAFAAALTLAVPVLLLARWAPRAASALHRAVLVLVALVAVALSQYFATTHVPLGADLFGYSWHDIRETVGASSGITIVAIVALVLIAAAAWLLPLVARKVPWPRYASEATLACALGVAAVPSLLVPSPSAFASDMQFYASVNKTEWFASRSVLLLRTRWRAARAAATLSGYPLMHRALYVDALGPHFTLRGDKPNFVIVIVEGLGRDFTGPRAEYGGFTPFLDSLTERSLSWDNFLSTSGRTFGILPSLLGSLPFGQSGFMELGAAMPAHASLVTYLQRNGYATNYFTGTNGQFDRIDTFMERQGVDRFIDAAGFGPSYTKEPPPPGGESWGYPDGALFTRSLELLANAPSTPRLDVYLTISTHEPFIPPDSARYQARFTERLAALKPSEQKAELFRENAGVFASLLYTDDALRAFFAAYATRPEYARTIFIVTGDHRMIPVPALSRIARYHVPLVVYSPMLRAPQHFPAVSSHFDVLPSLLALLHEGYAIPVPDSVPWLGSGLDTTSTFRHAHAFPLMRTKNELDDYLDGTHYLAGGQTYQLDADFGLSALRDGDARAVAMDALERFRAVNTYVTSQDRVMPHDAMAVVLPPDPKAMAREDSAFHALGLDVVTPEQAFTRARDLAAQRDYEGARLVARRLLRDAPSYHDARALLGRTYSWEGRASEARAILDDLVRRAPGYADGFAARISEDVFEGHGEEALAAAERALATFPGDPSLLYEKARALELVGRRDAALRALDELRRVAPVNPDANALRARLQRK